MLKASQLFEVKVFEFQCSRLFNNLENQSPIYNQILQQEQIELHKLGQWIKSHSGTILDYNTDAINCVFEDNKFPFELVEDIQLKGHYWNKADKAYKYKLNTIKIV